MGRQSSFVFIFSQPGSLAPHLSLRSWWLRRFVIFGGPSRSQTRFALMDQLPSPPRLRLRKKTQHWAEGHTVQYPCLYMHIKAVILKLSVLADLATHVVTVVTVQGLTLQVFFGAEVEQRKERARFVLIKKSVNRSAFFPVTPSAAAI